MRILPLLVVLPLCAAPALAQPAASPSPTTADTPAAAPSVAAPAPRATAKRPTSHRGESWEKRFSAANTTHDGHLTLDQAKSGYLTIARHFKAIDADHKGYVTVEDIRAWHKAQRDSRHRTAVTCPDTRLQARPALHRTMIEPPQVPNGPPPAAPKLTGSRSPS